LVAGANLSVYQKYDCMKGRSVMDYKKAIIDMVENIESNNFLEFLYNLIISFKKEWGY